jgi:hypothetical protein
MYGKKISGRLVTNAAQIESLFLCSQTFKGKLVQSAMMSEELAAIIHLSYKRSPIRNQDFSYKKQLPAQ